MSPSELALWTAAHRRVAGLTPDVAAALLRAFAILRESLSEGELARLIDSGQIETLIAQVFSDQTMDRAFIPFRQRLRDTTQSSFRYAIPSLPKAGKVDGVVSVMFDHLSPHVRTALVRLESSAITGLREDIRASVRSFIAQGIEDGVSPRTVARQIRSIVGMSPTQTENAMKFEAGLQAAAKPLSAERIAAKVETYRRKAVALNASTIARTATLDAYKEGQRIAWQDAIDKGIVSTGNLMHQWIGVADDRERPEHVAMNNEVQPYDSPYSNGELVPGDSPDTYNCRCLDRFFVA